METVKSFALVRFVDSCKLLVPVLLYNRKERNGLGGTMNFCYGLRFFTWVGLAYLSLTGPMLRAEDWKPRSQDYQTRESRQECSVYRSVFTTTKETLKRKMQDQKELVSSTKQQFEKLQDCRKKNGLDLQQIPEGDAKTAEVCADVYDSWLLDGTHLITVQDEIEGLKEEMSTLQGAVSRKCLPIMVAELK